MKKAFAIIAIMSMLMTFSSCGNNTEKGKSVQKTPESTSKLPNAKESNVENESYIKKYTMADAISFEASELLPMQIFNDAAIIAPTPTNVLDIDINNIEQGDKINDDVADFLMGLQVSTLQDAYDLMSDFVLDKAVRSVMHDTGIKVYKSDITMQIDDGTGANIYPGVGTIYLFEHKGRLIAVTEMMAKDTPDEDRQVITDIINTIELVRD